MSVLKIILGAVVGTSIMTVFTFFISYRQNKQFKEPVLLNNLLRNTEALKNRKIPTISGWLIHYGAGISFVVAYHFIWKFTAIDPSLTSGIVMGLINGIFGASVWALVFYSYKNPPVIDYGAFYLHLLPAHTIFGLGAVLGYSLV